MKRLHLHVGVEDLNASIDFYSTLFGAAPTRTKADYAKWALDDPSINFAISTRVKSGVDHLGIEVDEADELTEIRMRLSAAQRQLFDEGETQCCYHKSDKTWVVDPSGVAWETFRTMENLALFDARTSEVPRSCCA